MEIGMAKSANILQLSQNSSVFLNLLRALAAEAVLVGHSLNYLGIYPIPEKIPYFQSLMVSVFFILSGFLAMYSYYRRKVQTKGTYTIWQYFTNRFSRIFPAYIIALIFVFIFDTISINVFPQSYAFRASYNLNTFIANLLMLQDFPYFHSIPIFSCGTFGSAAQFWTLNIEWWCYILFGLLIIGNKYRKRVIYWIACCCGFINSIL